MSRRRYAYSYSPLPGRERGRPTKPAWPRGWMLLSLVVVLVAGAVIAHQSLMGGHGGESAAARSNCWIQVACSANHVESNANSSFAEGETPAEDSGEPETSVSREDYDAEEDGVEEAPPAISAAAAVVLEEPCGAVVHAYNAHSRLSPASLTKIVTALVAAEHADISQTVRVTVDGGSLSAATDATVMGLRPGQSMSMVDLLYGMLLPSGNDAAIEIAEQVAGSVEEFAVLMNAKVEEIGLNDTRFANPHGLDEPGHFTSAYDIAVLGADLLRHPDLAAIVGTRSYQPAWDGPRVRNLNLLLGQYPGALGVKTGYTDQAGQTIVAAAEREGRRFVVSVLGSADIFSDATALLDWAFGTAPSVCDKPSDSQVSAGG